MATEASCLVALSAGKMQTGLLEVSPFKRMQVSYGFFNLCLLAFICFLVRSCVWFVRNFTGVWTVSVPRKVCFEFGGMQAEVGQA